MWKSNKLPGYTIIELIIIMVLTGILSALTFSALTLFSQNFFFFQKITRRSYELTLFHKLMLKDIDGAQKVETVGPASLRCVYVDTEIQYDFETDQVLRRSAALVDTFHFAVHDYKYELLSASDKVVQSVTFELHISEQVLPYIFKKEYPADVFINENEEQ